MNVQNFRYIKFSQFAVKFSVNSKLLETVGDEISKIKNLRAGVEGNSQSKQS